MVIAEYWFQNKKQMTSDIYARADSTFAPSPANERRRYFVTTSPVGWVQA